MFDAFIRVFLERRAELGELFLDHLGMTVTAVVVSLLIGIPLGIRMQRSRALAGVLLARRTCSNRFRASRFSPSSFPSSGSARRRRF